MNSYMAKEELNTRITKYTLTSKRLKEYSIVSLNVSKPSNSFNSDKKYQTFLSKVLITQLLFSKVLANKWIILTKRLKQTLKTLLQNMKKEIVQAKPLAKKALLSIYTLTAATPLKFKSHLQNSSSSLSLLKSTLIIQQKVT